MNSPSQGWNGGGTGRAALDDRAGSAETVFAGPALPEPLTTLVLGATGFLGGAIAFALRDAGEPVRALTRGRTRRYVPALDVEWVPGDLRDFGSLREAFRGVRRVVHAAGHYPTVSLDRDAVVERGVVEMRNVLRCALEENVERLVYTSSLSTIGPPAAGRALAEEDDLYVPGTAKDAYFETKWAMESEVLRAVASHGLDAVVTAPTIVFGPGDVKPTSGALLLHLAKGRLPAFVEADVNVVDVRAVAASHVAALERGRRGERYVLGGVNTTTREFLSAAASAVGASPPRLWVPFEAAHAASLASEVAARFVTRKPPVVPLEFVSILRHSRHVSSAKASRELGHPETDLSATLRDAVRWFATHRYM